MASPGNDTPELRWRLTDEEDPRLFDDAGGWIPGREELAGLQLLHVRAKRVINAVPERSRMPFRWTVNPYRGCSHACTYCFARPTHEYLGLDAGDDFDRRIVVKVNAVDRVRAELRGPRWRGEEVALGTNTDPYQVVEGRYRLTRGVLATLAEQGNPFSVLSKSPLMLRDRDVLTAAAGEGLVSTAFSIASLDRALWRAIEPHAPNPERRMEAVAELNAAGVPCGVLMAPVVPGLSDDEASLRAVVTRAVEAGATWITPLVLHLRPGVREHFLERMRAHDPERAEDIARRYPGAYQPQSCQRELSARVRRLVAEAGGLARRDLSRRFTRPSTPVPVPDHQLRLT
jgi:DNA repair photolyase